MTASIDSTTSIFTKAIQIMVLWGSCAMVFAILGCNRIPPEPNSMDSMTQIPSELITRHGQLRFMKDVNLGRQISAELDKPCLLFFTAEWCTYCRQMEETAFTDTSIGDLSENFVCILIDADQNPQVCEEFSVTGFPTIQFVSSQGQALNRLVGRQTAPALASGMQSALKRFAWINDSETRLR